MSEYHYSVLKNEVLDLFRDKPLTIYVDGTLGAGGHAEAVLSLHPEIEKFIGIDQDRDALAIAKNRLLPWKEKVVFQQGNFSSVIPELENGIDAILLDLGVSSMQFDRAERGFSFSKPGPLDMRMDQKAPLSAKEVVNTWSEQELGRIIRDYGEEKQWRTAARAIVEARKEAPLQTTEDLVAVLRPLIRRKKGKEINPLTQIFQAIRICVNSELEVIRKVLPKCLEKLKPGGVLAIITFHSLEDRIVKKFFRYAASDKVDTSGLGGVFLDKEPEVFDLTRKPIIPSLEELEENPRSRSAKLRAVRKREG